MSTKSVRNEPLTQAMMRSVNPGHIHYIGLKNLGKRLAGTYLLRETGCGGWGGGSAEPLLPAYGSLWAGGELRQWWDVVYWSASGRRAGG